MATKLSTSRLSGEIRAGVLLCRGGVDLEAAVKRGPYFDGIEEYTPADFVDGEIAVRHPLIECPGCGAGFLAIGEYDFSAFFDADQLVLCVCAHRQSKATEGI